MFIDKYKLQEFRNVIHFIAAHAYRVAAEFDFIYTPYLFLYRR